MELDEIASQVLRGCGVLGMLTWHVVLTSAVLAQSRRMPVMDRPVQAARPHQYRTWKWARREAGPLRRQLCEEGSAICSWQKMVYSDYMFGSLTCPRHTVNADSPKQSCPRSMPWRPKGALRPRCSGSGVPPLFIRHEKCSVKGEMVERWKYARLRLCRPNILRAR